ncbi:hypothetical protein ARMSODRAFT_961877 [Armillaria solidipes]|uniref:Protein kinase domain-containing protein n=1 Tax=Armillaria solidipes TaxID=1076256 RepID=A0A2H3BLG0_9AGAR|nr:hypothetical protein ARMSODRAFT_961877 [Armillaria solidipes]
MPNEEDADVLIMEYVEGKSLEDWLSERPEHTKPEDLGDKDAEYVEETKRMVSFLFCRRAGGTSLISSPV